MNERAKIDVPTVTLNYQKRPVVSSFWRGKHLWYGTNKIGKTVQLSRAKPGAFILRCEPGTDHVEHAGEDIESWEKLIGTYRAIASEKKAGKFPFGLLGVDTGGRAFQLCRDYIFRMHKITHETDEAFGKGSSLVDTEFSRMVNSFCQLGLGIVFTAHSEEVTKKIKGRESTKVVIDLPKNAKKCIQGLVDFMLYFELEDDEEERPHRVIHTRGTNLYEAGVRYPPGWGARLPDTVPMDVNALAEIWDAGAVTADPKPAQEAAPPAETKPEPAPTPPPAEPANNGERRTGTTLQRRSA